MSAKQWTVDEIREMLEMNEKAVARGVVVIFRLQTADEQETEQTVVRNHQGYSAWDAEIMSSFAKRLLSGRRLTPRQMAVAKKRIKKYAGQLTRVANGELVVS